MLIRDELILASSSARRQDLLRHAGIAFAMHSPEIPEVRSATEKPLEYALRLAQEKALAVAKPYASMEVARQIFRLIRAI